MDNKRSYLFATLLLLLAAVAANAQEPQALLRANENAAAPAAEQYYVELQMNAPLKAEVYQALSEANPPQIGLLLSKGVPLTPAGSFTNTFIVSPADGGKRTRFRMYVPADMAPFTDFAKQKFAVLLTNYLDNAGKPVVRVLTVDKVFSRELATDFAVCRRNQFGMSVDYDLADAYSFTRAEQLYDYLTSLKTNPTKLQGLKISVEPLTRKQVETHYVTGVTVYPATKEDLKHNDTMSACFATDGDVPTEKFDAELLLPADAPVEFIEPKVVTGLTGLAAEASPEVFASKDKAVGLRPIDKDLNVALSLVSSVKDVEQPDKTTLRQRNTIGTLDLRVGLLRDVERLSVRENKVAGALPPLKECGVVSKYTPATSTEAGTITIGGYTPEGGIAPGVDLPGVVVGAEQCLHFKWVDDAGAISSINTSHPSDPVFTPFITGLEPPDVTAGTYSIFTPFYVDAKVSTGKITKDTASLNRVVFGTQEELRYYANNFRFPTFYRFIFQGNHASDRDFKQREFKGTFEFRPVFGPLNHPYDPTNTTARARELCPTCKPLFKLLPIRYGYEFVPVVGAEIGKTYFRHRPAEAVKPSDTVRRIYFGFDSTLYPTPNVTFTASELLYVRGEKKDDRLHNYFLGEFAYRLDNFSTARAAHSIFFSWERGGQPPFDDQDVNVLKVGYRLTATTIFSRFR
jgi:hypothetical protein